jgi:hypothetical protein
MSEKTASSWASIKGRGIGYTDCIPRLFWAVKAVITLIP